MAGTCCKEHFTLKQLSPWHDVPKLFIVSQWQSNKSQPHLIYLIYRTLQTIFFMVTWILSWGTGMEQHSYYIFLTNWGYTLCTLQSLLAYVLLIFSFLSTKVCNGPKLQEHILKLHPVYWMMHSAATSTAFMITVIFWAILYEGMMFNAMNFFVHACNSILSFIDLCVIGHPVRILHVIYPVIFGIAYLIFSVAYYFYDKNRGGPGYVYFILDWNKPGPTILVVLAITVFVICLHLLTFAVHKIKMIIHNKIYPEKLQSTECQTQSTEQLSKYI